MTVPSTIAYLNALRGGQNQPDIGASMPTAPKPIKATPVLTEEQVMERESMRSRLQVGTWVIEFKKTDGTTSIMEATLDTRLVPSMGNPGNGYTPTNIPEQAHLLRVYAVDRQGWRSFVTTNVIRFYKAGEVL